jgi:phage gpG-like protein
VSVSIKIELDANSRRWLRDLREFAPKVMGAVAQAMERENALSVGAITTERLSFPKEGPTVAIGLRVITNRLRGSIRATVPEISGTDVTSTIGSNVKYAAIHEFGGRTAPHVIKAKPGKTLAFSIGGKQVFAKSVNHPGSKMPARRYVSGVVEERAPRYTEAIGAAIEKAFLSLGGAPV